MVLSQRRGRPKKQHEGKDCGTPELMAKRSHGLTAETLDICLKRDIITTDEHWAGIHFRWLYTLCFGAPGISALDISYLGGRSLKTENQDWQKQREQEYAAAIAYLRAQNSKSLVMNICLFNQCPAFLQTPATVKQESVYRRYKEYVAFKEALAGLFRLFRGEMLIQIPSHSSAG